MSVSEQHMNQLALPSGAVGPLVIGICIVIVLVGAIVLGMRHLRREPHVTETELPRSGSWETPEEYEEGAEPDDHGPGHQGDGHRSTDSREVEPNVMPQDGRRRLPQEVDDSGVRGGRVRTHVRRHSGPNVD